MLPAFWGICGLTSTTWTSPLCALLLLLLSLLAACGRMPLRELLLLLLPLLPLWLVKQLQPLLTAVAVEPKAARALKVDAEHASLLCASGNHKATHG
jgi:hypothetical protein